MTWVVGRMINGSEGGREGEKEGEGKRSAYLASAFFKMPILLRFSTGIQDGHYYDAKNILLSKKRL